MKIVVTGSVAYDYLMAFPGRFTDHILPDQLETISVSFLVDSLRRERGGIGANIAYTLGLLGGQPSLMETVGEDFVEYRAWLEQNGVDTTPTKVIEGKYCASFFANFDEAQNQIGSFYTGAMAHAGELRFAELAPDVDLTIISPSDPAGMGTHVTECKERGIAYIYDPSQQTIRLTAEALRDGVEGCFMLTVNEYELGMIQEKTGMSKDEILNAAGAVLVTYGKEGSKIYADGQTFKIPVVPPPHVAEPTGAGDAYRAGLMRGIQLGLGWELAGQMGALCAAYDLEQVGTQNHHFTRAEFVARFRKHFNDEGALDVLLA